MRVLEKKDKSKVGRLTSSVACTKYGEVPGPETTVGGRGKGSGCGWQGKEVDSWRPQKQREGGYR